MSWCLLVLALRGAAPTVAGAAALPADSWHLLAALPVSSQDPLFALDADPAAGDHLLAGTPSGAIFRSADGGASWRQAAALDGASVLAIAFDPLQPSVVLAGTHGGGVWRSANGGESWDQVPGTAPRTVRAFGFAHDLSVAATDRGLLVTQDGVHWSELGPDNVNVSAVAVTGEGTSAHLWAGSDAGAAGAGLPLYASADSGRTWSRSGSSLMGSNMVDVLAAWAGSGGPQIVLGTNAGAFVSTDDGGHWNPVSGGGTLPAVDVTAVRALATQPDQYYVGSDGGASDEGGLWVTRDDGQHFTALKPPVSAVTALTVGQGGGAVTAVYAATFRPLDHAVMLWSYRDDGGAPQAGAAAPAPRASGLSTAASVRGAGGDWLQSALRGPEAPFLALGVGALLLLVVAWVTYARRARRL